MQTGVEERTPPFGVEERRVGGVAVVRAAGRLVAGVGVEHPAWRAARDVGGTAQVVLDLRGVTAMDAGGVGELLRLRQSAHRHGVPVVIEGAAPRVRRVLQLTQLDTVFGLAVSAPSGAGLAGRLLCRCA